MHNETQVTYYCLHCRERFSISVRLDGCIMPMELVATWKSKCPTCGQPSGRAPFLGLANLMQVSLEEERLMLGRLPHDSEKDASPNRDLPAKSTALHEGEWLYFGDMMVSRKHAMLTRVDDTTHVIEDLESRGGTFVNDQLLRGRITLEAGDTIRIGRTEIRYCDDVISRG